MKMPGVGPAHAGGAHGVLGMSVTSGGMHLMPAWLGLVFTFALVVVVIAHFRHLVEAPGESRLWHASHVLMGVGMAVMFAPAAIDHIAIPAVVWQLLFANAAGVVLALLLFRTLEGRATNLLWLAAAADLAAMVYMWLGQILPLLSWVLVGYSLAGCVFWLLGADRRVDGRSLGGRAGGRVASLVCGADVRASLATMAFAMAYMFAAMGLAR